MISYTGFDPIALGINVKYYAGLHNVLCACPWHGGSDSLCVNLQTGAFICYSCGEKGGPGKLVRKTGGSASWTNFFRPDIKEQDEEWNRMLEGPLAIDNPYLISRRVTNEQVMKHNIRSCKVGIAIPLTDRGGKTVGALIRRREGKVRYIVLGEKPPIWPLPVLDTIKTNENVIVTEGIFGVLAAERAGLSAVAVLGARVKTDVRKWLGGVRPNVVFDQDMAGYIGAIKMLQLIPDTRVLMTGAEADEMSPEQWKMICEQNNLWTSSIRQLGAKASQYMNLSEAEFWEHAPAAPKVNRKLYKDYRSNKY